MIKFKTFIAEEVLLEITIKDHYEKYVSQKYPKLLFGWYREITEIDPTSTNGNRGKYVEWLVKVLSVEADKYFAGKINDLFRDYTDESSDLPLDKITRSLARYDKYPNKKDINTFKTTNEFVAYVEALPPTQNEIKEQNKLIFNKPNDIKIIEITDEWIVTQVLSKEGNVLLARYKCPQSAQWCTADPRTDSHYESYMNSGKLFVFLNKNNPLEKYQIFLSYDRGIVEARDFNNENIMNDDIYDKLTTLSDRVVTALTLTVEDYESALDEVFSKDILTYREIEKIYMYSGKEWFVKFEFGKKWKTHFNNYIVTAESRGVYTEDNFKHFLKMIDIDYRFTLDVLNKVANKVLQENIINFLHHFDYIQLQNTEDKNEYLSTEAVIYSGIALTHYRETVMLFTMVYEYDKNTFAELDKFFNDLCLNLIEMQKKSDYPMEIEGAVLEKMLYFYKLEDTFEAIKKTKKLKEYIRMLDTLTDEEIALFKTKATRISSGNGASKVVQIANFVRTLHTTQGVQGIPYEKILDTLKPENQLWVEDNSGLNNPVAIFVPYKSLNLMNGLEILFRAYWFGGFPSNYKIDSVIKGYAHDVCEYIIKSDLEETYNGFCYVNGSPVETLKIFDILGRMEDYKKHATKVAVSIIEHYQQMMLANKEDRNEYDKYHAGILQIKTTLDKIRSMVL